jgi:hypothetical protein
MKWLTSATAGRDLPASVHRKRHSLYRGVWMGMALAEANLLLSPQADFLSHGPTA